MLIFKKYKLLQTYEEAGRRPLNYEENGWVLSKSWGIYVFGLELVW